MNCQGHDLGFEDRFGFLNLSFEIFQIIYKNVQMSSKSEK